MSFGSPYLLVSLLAVPLVAASYLVLDARRRRRSASWSTAALLPNMVEGPMRRLRHVPVALFLLALGLLLVGFARPKRTVIGSSHTPATVVLTFDVSGSMAARDVSPSRLRVARQVALRFLNELPSRYSVSVVTFGDKVRVVVPPTLDRSAVRAHLPARITPKAGTSLGDGISAGVAIVTQAAGKSNFGSGYPGLVLVFSDGAQTAGGTAPSSAATTALVERVPVDTVTVGTQHGVVVQPLKVDGFATTQTISVPADPGAMQSIAREAGGVAYTVSSPARAAIVGTELAHAVHELRASSLPERHVQDLSAALGVAALVSILAGVTVSGIWFGRVA